MRVFFFFFLVTNGNTLGDLFDCVPGARFKCLGVLYFSKEHSLQQMLSRVKHIMIAAVSVNALMLRFSPDLSHAVLQQTRRPRNSIDCRVASIPHVTGFMCQRFIVRRAYALPQ